MRLDLSSRWLAGFLPALAGALALSACSHSQGAADSGTTIQIIPTQTLDGGGDGGVPDAGGKTDAGPLQFDAGGPVPVTVTEVSPDRGSVAGAPRSPSPGPAFSRGC